MRIIKFNNIREILLKIILRSKCFIFGQHTCIKGYFVYY